jgi:hypothetical protein
LTRDSQAHENRASVEIESQYQRRTCPVRHCSRLRQRLNRFAMHHMSERLNGTHSNVTGTGIRLKFPCFTEIPGPKTDYHHLDVEVLIVSAERWTTLNEPKKSTWDGQLLDDGRVVALRITDRDARKRRIQSHDAPQPWDVEQLRKLRAQILDFFEDQDDVIGLELDSGGNGPCVIRVTKEGNTRMPDGFNIRLDCYDPMGEDD